LDHVFVEETPVQGREHHLTPGAVIGREGCDIVLADPRVSRRHATLHLLDSGPAIEDLGSSNGTFVNELRITGVMALAPGDRVRLGNTVLRFGTVAASPAPPPPPPPPSAPPPAPTPPPPPAPAPAAPLPFEPMPSRRVRGSAATRVEATVVCFAIVAATAIALILYFALYEP
jgi:hypothetical protein